jgi:hypothetical protein
LPEEALLAAIREALGGQAAPAARNEQAFAKGLAAVAGGQALT